ncbi:dihydrodipicolinate synthase family protein, partial [Shigella flexneri]
TVRREIMSSISGILAATATPFDEDENIAEAALRAHVRRQLTAGVHGIFALGTNSEFYAQSAAERAEAARIVIDEVAGAVPVVIGAGAATTWETVRREIMSSISGILAATATPFDEDENIAEAALR